MSENCIISNFGQNLLVIHFFCFFDEIAKPWVPVGIAFCIIISTQSFLSGYIDNVLINKRKNPQWLVNYTKCST